MESDSARVREVPTRVLRSAVGLGPILKDFLQIKALYIHERELTNAAVFCSVLKHITLCCSVFQRVVVHCSGLQCAAV